MSGRRIDLDALPALIGRWAAALGFSETGISGIDLSGDEARLVNWLAAGRHGEMDYMARHGRRRSRPAELVPGTLSVVSVRMDYWPGGAARPAEEALSDPLVGYVARYALGRDYHRLMRRRLQRLADRIAEHAGPFGYRAFVDSAPVLERALARGAGLGWTGKHTNLIGSRAGSWFFLGELYTDLPLRAGRAPPDHCGRCQACIDACPTGAIVAPYELDARRCISYLTIEHPGSIPVELRPAVGNRVFGCDDCQLVCPWNRFAPDTAEAGFAPRHGLDRAPLTELFAWDEADFARYTEGSAIRRLGHERWLRNVAVALGNAPTTAAVVDALRARRGHPSALVREHVAWALGRHRRRRRHRRAARREPGGSGRRAHNPPSREDLPDMNDLKRTIEDAFERRAEIGPGHADRAVVDAVETTLGMLDRGEIRVAEKSGGEWTVHEWTKQAVLLSFRLRDNAPMRGGVTHFFDKVPLKFAGMDEAELRAAGVRVVPPAFARYGAYVAPGVVLMPSYVNLGAWVGSGTMVDTWATVGSCAQIGKNVHLSGGVGIGGVLEPLQASPTIIEDDCFIGARSEIVEGVVVEEGAVVSMGVFIGQSTRIYDRETGEIHRGRVPAGAVVVPGSLPAPDGSHSLACAVIVKRVDAKTRARVGLNELLRDV